jgi:diacylglycerol kinase family enzyme
VIRRTPRQAPKMIYMQGEETIQIDCESILPVQADGEVVGETPVTIHIIPNAIKVLLPTRPYDPILDFLRQVVGIKKE